MNLYLRLTIFFYRYPIVMYLILGLGLLVLQVIFRINIVYAMDRDESNIKNIYDHLALGQDNEARIGLENMYRNSNEEQRTRLRALLIETNNMYNFAEYTVNTDTFTLMNAGQIPQENTNLRDILIRLSIAATIVTVGVIILRHWSSIRDFFFDFGQTVAHQAVDSVITYGLRRTFASLSIHRNALVHFLNEANHILYANQVVPPAA